MTEILSILSDVLYLDESVPSGLRWRVNITSGRNKIQVYAGTPAGTISPSGYWVVKYRNRNYQCHRVIWYFINGEIPNGIQVDHIDHNRSNNNIENLRLVSHAENGRNQKKRSDNKSGHTGVCVKECGTYIRYQARWVDLNGKEKSKSFKSTEHSDAYEKACLYREAMIKSLNVLGAGYSEGHGK